jgi:Transcriptional regulator
MGDESTTRHGTQQAAQGRGLDPGLRQPMLDNTLILAFLAVVDLGSYTLAAQTLHRTQSAISLQIKRLEEALGVPLFENPRQQVQLSAHGEAFLDYARRLVALNREALASVDHGALKGLIRIGSNHFYASEVLPSLLATFCAENAEVQVELSTGGQTRLSSGLGAQFDLVVNFHLAADYQGQILSRERLHWIQGMGADVWSKDPLPVALLPKDNLLRTIMLDHLAQMNRPWRMVYESQSVDATIAAVAAGLAVSICVGSRLALSGTRLRTIGDPESAGLPDCVFTIETAPRAVSRATKALHDYILAALDTGH